MKKIVNGVEVELSSEEIQAKSIGDAADAIRIENEKKYLYKKLRAKEYPPITDQLDLIFHKGLEAWKEQIQSIKTKYPKPEGL